MVKFIEVWGTGVPTEVISGGAPGADSLGERFAAEHGLPVTIFHADWERYGKAAGIIRNTDIIDAADIVFAFWDGKSPGTKDSIKKAMSRAKTLFVCRYLDRDTKLNIATIEHLYDE